MTQNERCSQTLRGDSSKEPVSALLVRDWSLVTACHVRWQLRRGSGKASQTRGNRATGDVPGLQWIALAVQVEERAGGRHRNPTACGVQTTWARERGEQTIVQWCQLMGVCGPSQRMGALCPWH